MKRYFYFLITILISKTLYSQEYNNLNYTNYRQANKIVSFAIQASNYDSIDSFKYTLTGNWNYLGHFPLPEQRKIVPVKNTYSLIKDSVYKLSSQITWDNETMLREEYFSADSTSVIDYDSQDVLTNYNLRKDSYLLFNSPVSLIWDMIENKSSIRYIGIDSTSDSHVISYISSFEKQASVFIDINNYEIKSVQFIKYDDIQGDYLLQYFYQGYTKTDKGFYLPSEIVIKGWQDVLYNMTYNYIDIQTVAKTDPLEGYSLKEIDKNLYLISYPTGYHKSYLVDFGDYVGVIEIPINESYAQNIIQVVKNKFPDKPVKYGFLTHHHPDHAGGFNYFYKNGADIVTTELSHKYQQKLLKREHSLRKDSVGTNGNNGNFIIVPAKEELKFSTKDMKLEIYEFGDNKHTKEFLLYYFPQSKTLIVGDLFYTPIDSVRPGRLANDILSFIKDKKLKVESLYPTWSPLNYREYSTMENLTESAKLYQQNLNK